MILFYLFEILAGIVTYFLSSDMFVTTGVILFLSISKVVYQLLRYRHINLVASTISFALCATCLATIISHDMIFIQWKGMTTTLAICLFLMLYPIYAKTSPLHHLIKSLPIEFDEEEVDEINSQTSILFLIITWASMYFFWHSSPDMWFSFKTFTVPQIFLFYVLYRIVLAIFSGKIKWSRISLPFNETRDKEKE